MKDKDKDKQLSKRISYVLRHSPESIGIELDPAGWTEVAGLITGLGITKSQLDIIVENNNKKRFEYSVDGKLIRARQGHSVDVDLGYSPEVPPDYLYHGTSYNFIDSILLSGLKKMERHHVHLSPDQETARMVGSRKGSPVIFRVKSGQMHKDGNEFFKTENNVWLTEYVDPIYLEML